MEQEPKSPSEILSEGTKMRIELLNTELENLLDHSGRLQEIITSRQKLSDSLEKYYTLSAELATNPEGKDDMDILEKQMREIQEVIKNEKVSNEEIDAYIKKIDEMRKKIDYLEHMLNPDPSTVKRN